MDTKQRDKALRRANKVRIGVSDLRKDLKSGKLSLRKALEDPRAQPGQVSHVLKAMPQWGPTRVRHLLIHRLDMNPAIELRRIKNLTKREKKLILEGVAKPDHWVSFSGKWRPKGAK